MELEEPEKYKEILCLVFNYVMLPPILPAYLFPKQKEKTVAKNKLKLQGMNKVDKNNNTQLSTTASLINKS
jgi:hypothetical protein